MTDRPFNQALASELSNLFKVFNISPGHPHIDRLHNVSAGLAKLIEHEIQKAAVEVTSKLQEATIKAFRMTEDRLDGIEMLVKESDKLVVKLCKEEIERLRKDVEAITELPDVQA